jgi:polyhydroxyalkanoate synthase
MPALGLEAARRLREMLEGIERYQRHPYARDMADPPEIWRAGSARLLDYGQAPEAADPEGPAVLAAPSLVNRAWVLDLHPRRSLMRALAAAGFRPLLLDWGDPGPEERGFDLSAYYARRLVPAAEAAAAAAGGPVAVLGYCMGGAFAAALAARRPELVSRLALIGAPWDFARMEGLGAALSALAATEDAGAVRARLEGLGEMLGAVPVDLLQLGFAALDPTLALRKFRRFARMPQGSEAAELFVATEDWLNAGPALAAPAAVDVAVGWYMENRTACGAWRVAGAAVEPGAIAAPALAFCSTTDRIAPPPCAEALARAIPGARLRRPRTGHVGMVVAASAEKEVWRPLARFLSEG